MIRNIDFKSVNEFWIIYIGFIRKRIYNIYLKFDYYHLNNPTCCINIKNIPIDNQSCKMIHIKHFFQYFPSQNFNKIIKSWKKILIPGGVLKIQIKLKNNEKELKKLKTALNHNHFYIKNINKYDLKINGSLTIIAIKQNAIETIPTDISIKKFNDIILIIKQNKDLFSNEKKICILGNNSQKIVKYLKDLNLNFKEIKLFNSLNSLSSISENHFDCAIITNYFEYSNYSTNNKTFNEFRRILKPNSNILSIIPEKMNYYSNNSAQIFDKGIFIKILDENNLKFKWINLSSTFRMIQVFIKNKNNFPLDKKQIKVVLLGVYSLRYNFINNARWDSQARAFERLGYDTKIFDIKDNSFPYLLEHIKLYNPDILWIAGKIAYDFLRKYAKFFRFSKIKVVYWYWDISLVKEFDDFDFNGVIDYMFITSIGEIPLYKQKYNLKKVYYMPVAMMPEIIHRNKDIKEEYDIGFAGGLGMNPFHKKRTLMIKYIMNYFKVKIFNNIFNNLPEYYSKCKIIFGGTPDLKDVDMYASNRIYAALSGGCCFITNYFKGLERLVENEKHLIWYNNKKELKSYIEKFLFNKTLREEIKNNAEKLAKEKHNYIFRMNNMLDIINGKTEDFYGFIK